MATASPIGFLQGWTDEDGEDAKPMREFDPSRPGDVVVVAESFAEFLHHFWSDNEAWYAAAGLT